MRVARYAAITLLAATALTASHPSLSHARPASLTLTTLYMTTDPAYTAYDPNHPVAPPKVTAFPTSVRFLGVYFVYAGAHARVTAVHVDFTQGARVVRKGQNHVLGGSTGEYILDLPSEGLLSAGTYQARVYVGITPVAAISFSLIATPSVTKGYMITGVAYDLWNPQGKAKPARATSFPANPARVGFYFAYTGAGKSDVYHVAIYDGSGFLVHRGKDHLFLYRPGGDIATILPAAGGSYVAGSYRTDLYDDGALIFSAPWTVK